MGSRWGYLMGFFLAALVFGQTPPRPQFEAASIRPGAGCETRQRSPDSPGRLTGFCNPLRLTIAGAYGGYANPPKINNRLMQVIGGPAWIDDWYEINAVAAGGFSTPQMHGPMMQALLEDRFQLRIHREAREMPIYSLSIAKDGLKIRPRDASTCIQDGSGPLSEDAARFLCGSTAVEMEGANMTYIVHGMSMAELAETVFSRSTGRQVFDKTGLNGVFDFRLDFVRSGALGSGDAATGTDAAASIFTAVQDQLGLKLTSDRGPVDVLVIDHLERPSEN